MSNIGLVPAIGSGEIRLMVGGGWSTEADETVSTASFDHLELHRGHYLDFNCLVPHASRIRSLWINSDCSSSSGLEKLTNVERLKISYPLGREFDFRAFPRLRHVSIDGWEKSYSVSLFECSQLESLSIEGFDQADLSDFRGLTCLRSLVLAKGKLQSLSGLANCSSLNSISLSHLRSLTNIEVVFQLIELRKLELIEALPKLNFPEAITRLHSLSHLDLRGVPGGLKDVTWLRGLLELEVLLLPAIGTVDWDSVFSSPRLTKLLVGPSPKSMSETELIEIAKRHQLEVVDISVMGSKKTPAYIFDLRPIP